MAEAVLVLIGSSTSGRSLRLSPLHGSHGGLLMQNTVLYLYCLCAVKCKYMKALTCALTAPEASVNISTSSGRDWLHELQWRACLSLAPGLPACQYCPTPILPYTPSTLHAAQQGSCVTVDHHMAVQSGAHGLCAYQKYASARREDWQGRLHTVSRAVS